MIKSHHNVGGLRDYVDFKEIIEPLRDLFKDEVRKAGLELGLPERLVFRQPFPGPGLGIRIIGEVTEEKVKLRDLFKDEVRKAGLELGLPERLVFRQPFPGPGLGIRIIGEVTEEKVKIVQDADAIYREEMDAAGMNKTVGQYFAALTNMRSVGVMGEVTEEKVKIVQDADAIYREEMDAAGMNKTVGQYFAALTNMRSVGVMGDERTYDYAVALRAVNTIDFDSRTVFCCIDKHEKRWSYG